MGLYCALGAKDFEDGIILAVITVETATRPARSPATFSAPLPELGQFPIAGSPTWNYAPLSKPWPTILPHSPNGGYAPRPTPKNATSIQAAIPSASPVGVRRLAVAFLPPST